MKNWKQFTFVAIIAIVGIIMGFVACDNNGNDTTIHEHKWGDWTVTTASTCTTEGEKTRVCTLDATHKETQEIAIDPTAHDWNNPVITAGYESRICKYNSSHIDIKLTLNLGDTGPGGGKIFYRSDLGFTMRDTDETCYYLEAAIADMPEKLAWVSPAFTTSENDPYVNNYRIGYGRLNTELILSVDTDAPAAKACNVFSNNGKTDWFLPSQNELIELYNNRDFVGNFETSNPSAWYSGYLSSTQNGAYFRNGAIAINFNDGSTTGLGIGPGLVRAIRAF